MKVRLDTHTFIWFIAGSPRLSAPARAAIEATENDRFLSAASIFEMAIKEENVKTLPMAIFDKVDKLAPPPLVEYREQDPCARPELPYLRPSMVWHLRRSSQRRCESRHASSTESRI